MNKSELIARIAETTELSPNQAERVLNAIIDVITKALSAGESVSILGFGTFMVRERAARTGRNPRTGESIKIRASKTPVFKAGKLLKHAAGGYEESITSSFRDSIQARSPIAHMFEVSAAPPQTKKDSPNYALMNVFFATDRKQNEGADIKSRFGTERGELKYGTTQVSIPRDHKMGEIESRSIWRLEFRDDPEKHVVVLDISTIDKSTYYEAVAKRVNKSGKKCAFIFVHGYNVTFEEAAKRTAQMSYDLGFDGAPVFYSWPSHGSIPKYPFDEDNIIWAQTNIEMFLKDFAENSGAESIYLIAHSMGNRALTRAYISVINENPELKSRFTEIILAAPDIDADVFKRDIAPAMHKAGNPVTLYASSEDVPLKASRKFHGGHPRAGDSGQNLMILSGVESIDATNVETGFLGHSYYADERSVISDMFYILNESLRANKRAGLNEVAISDGVYWEFKK
jgi:esterase/lipase superfamily enzyme/nucleoid DNA-binding protein